MVKQCYHSGNLHTTSKPRFVKPNFWYQMSNIPIKKNTRQKTPSKEHLSHGFGHIHQGRHASPTPSHEHALRIWQLRTSFENLDGWFWMEELSRVFLQKNKKGKGVVVKLCYFGGLWGRFVWKLHYNGWFKSKNVWWLWLTELCGNKTCFSTVKLYTCSLKGTHFP